MKGVGSYNDWAYYASPSSNLSAFAAPFSVNRPNSNDASAPFVDSTESLDDVVPQIQFPSYGYDFFSNPVRELDSTPSVKPYVGSRYQVNSSSAQLPHFDSMGLPSDDAFSYDQCSNSTKPSIVKASPYYPSYISSQIHDPIPSVGTNHWSSSPGFASLDGSSIGDYANKSAEIGFAGQRGGLWNQFPEFNHGKSKQVGVGSCFSSKQTDITGSVGEERMKQGCQDLEDSNNGGVLLLPHHMIGWEKNSDPVNADQLDDKSCWWETVKPMPVEFSAKSVMGSPSVSLETHHEAPLNSVADSGNRHLSCSGSYDKNSRQHDKPSGVDTVSSTPIAGLVMDLNIGSTIADGDPRNNTSYNIKEAYRMPSPGTAGCFDLSHLQMHLERNEPSQSNNEMVSDKNVSRVIVNDIFKERHGFQNPHASLDNLSLRLSAIEDVNSVEKSFEGANRCNPAVDSPCWKGAPVAHFSHHEASVTLPPQHVHKQEEFFGSVIQEPQNFLHDNNNNVKNSYENSNSYHYQETSVAGSPTKFSVTKFASEDCNSDGAVNAGSFQSEPTLDDINEMMEYSVPSTKSTYDYARCNLNKYMHGATFQSEPTLDDINEMMENSVPSTKSTYDYAGCNLNKYMHGAPFQSEPTLDDINEMMEYIVPSTKSTYDCESGSSHTLHHVIDENKLMFQKQHNLCFGGADAGCNLNKYMHGAPYSEEYALSMRSLAVDAPNTLEKPAEKVSTQKLNVQMLVDTMHNLSELLLFHCVNDVCELKVRDHNVLKNVINNLNNCASKSAEQIAPAQECLSPKPETSSRCAGESCELEQNSSFERHRLTKVGPDSSKVELENPLVQEAKNLHFRSGKPHGKLSDSFSPRGEAEMTKEDNMTKALKRILGENFHDDEEAQSQTVLYKNLWLEAEAALCSVSYRARYNQMKIEMEKYSYKQRDMEEQSNPEVVPSLNENQSSATKVHIDPNSDSSGQDLSVLDATNLKDLSGLKFSADMNKPNASTPERNSSQDLDNSIQNHTVSGTKKETGNDEDSVRARFHVLKARVDKSCIIAANLEEPSAIAADKLAPRGRENQNQINLYQDSPIPGKNKADYEASVMARFHILKSRFEGSSSISSEKKLLDDTIITKDASEGKSFDVHVNPAAVHLSSYTAVDKKSIPKEFHPDLGNTQEIQPCGTYEDANQLPTYYSDGLASDWEHVEKRSL